MRGCFLAASDTSVGLTVFLMAWPEKASKSLANPSTSHCDSRRETGVAQNGFTKYGDCLQYYFHNALPYVICDSKMRRFGYE